MGADEAGDHAATVDVADERNRNLRGNRKSHVGDIARPQIDLGRAARAFDEHDIGLSAELRETIEDRWQQHGLAGAVIHGAQRSHALALHDHLRACLALGLQQHRVHVHRWWHAGRHRLHRLRPPDLAAIDCNSRVVRHVLRLEWHDLETAAHKRPGKAGDERRLAYVRARAHEHDGGDVRWIGDQNSTPFWAFTPALNGCLISVISVTRSAISISSGLALRPVITTCLSWGFSIFRKSITSASGR